MSKKSQSERDEDQPYDSMSDPEIETDEKITETVNPKVYLHESISFAFYSCFCT